MGLAGSDEPVPILKAWQEAGLQGRGGQYSQQFADRGYVCCQSVAMGEKGNEHKWHISTSLLVKTYNLIYIQQLEVPQPRPIRDLAHRIVWEVHDHQLDRARGLRTQHRLEAANIKSQPTGRRQRRSGGGGSLIRFGLCHLCRGP